MFANNLSLKNTILVKKYYSVIITMGVGQPNFPIYLIKLHADAFFIYQLLLENDE